ncbi:chymotrypsin-1 [Orussus abietinus]|uniref:chymotrypsin-1 n=1 Tax=Orussus abietinus TaxID=222816 RepID=UPI00062548BD|nr:chymotrypsin-1 [Orussus abietinus]
MKVKLFGFIIIHLLCDLRLVFSRHEPLQSTPARLGELPYHVAIYMQSRAILCSGTILNQRHVLSSAHCVTRYKDRPSHLDVVIGTIHRSVGGRWYNVYSVVIHPNYTGDGQHDLAILKTVLPMEMSEFSRPIKLPKFEDHDPLPGKLATVSGWKALPNEPEEYDDEGSLLQKAGVDVVPLKVCQELLAGTGREISSRHICAGNIYSQGSCIGDNASPLVLNNVQIGILSWGTQCGSGDPDVYTKIKSYLPWIRKNAFPYHVLNLV